MTHTLRVDGESLTISGGGLYAETVITVLLDGRRIWSFRAGTARVMSGSSLTVDWPPTVAERLSGRAELAVLADGAVIVAPTRVAFGQADTVVALVDPVTGAPLVVNKWGRLAPTFQGREETIIDDLLDEAEALEEFVRSTLGVRLFVTGGTLLGPVRDGRIIPGDDDVDFAYLSHHDNPSDVVVESLGMERALVAAGYEVVRLSGGHLQLMFPGRSVSDRFYIDIFAYFVCNGWFYGTFHARERASRVPLLPLRELDVDGRRMPAPADPERLLAAIYGPHWRTPDPAFTFVTPPSALRRFRGWLDDYNMDRENWEDHHRSRIARGDRPEPSPFAVETAELVPVGSRIVELGCGLGADAHHLASRGHEVVAVDYSRPALAYAQAGVTATVGAPRFDRVNLNLDRDAVRLLDDEVTGSGAVHVYGRSLFDALSERATGVTLRLVRQLLRHPDSSAHFEVESGARTRGRQWTEYDGVLLHELERTLASAGLSIAEHRREYENSQHAVERIIVRRDRG